MLNDFGEVFQSSVKDGISNTLGEIVMDSLKQLLKTPLTEYAIDPTGFHRDLQRIFASASSTLEKMIVKELFQKLRLHYSSELDFEASINLARQDAMLSKRKIRTQMP
jgi:hypothetical protein